MKVKQPRLYRTTKIVLVMVDPYIPQVTGRVGKFLQNGFANNFATRELYPQIRCKNVTKIMAFQICLGFCSKFTRCKVIGKSIHLGHVLPTQGKGKSQRFSLFP